MPADSSPLSPCAVERKLSVPVSWPGQGWAPTFSAPRPGASPARSPQHRVESPQGHRAGRAPQLSSPTSATLTHRAESLQSLLSREPRPPGASAGWHSPNLLQGLTTARAAWDTRQWSHTTKGQSTGFHWWIPSSAQEPVHRHRLGDNLPFSEVGRDLHLTVKASFFESFLCPTKVFAILCRDSAPWVSTYFSLACLSVCTTTSTPSLCLLMVDGLQPPRMKCMVPISLVSSPHLCKELPLLCWALLLDCWQQL